MLKESYVANLKNLPSDSIKVLVSRYCPRYIKREAFHLWAKELAPSKELLTAYKRGEIDWFEYERRFREEFSNSPEAKAILQALIEIAKERDVFLICYEKSPERCHRRLLLELANLKLEDV
jgi:uncharacterized protein YeaO (DUF488 family)